jgi:hypothetical protein
MNRALKDSWVAALRSGKYKQGFGTMHKVIFRKRSWYMSTKREDLFCPIGVLAKILSDSGVFADLEPIEGPLFIGQSESHATVRYGGFTSNLPYSVLTQIGLNINQASLVIDQSDCKELSFVEIADWIERNV